MKPKIVPILFLILICTTLSFAQTSFEEGLRQEFVKELKKKRDKERKKAGLKVEDNKVIATTPASAIEDDDIIKVETQLARTDILVFDPKGVAVLGLKADDFLIWEDNVPQEIGIFSLGDSEAVPRSIVLIIDYSNSQAPYIKTSTVAAKVLVDKLNPKDRMAIVTDDIELITDFTGNKEELKKNLDKIAKRAGGGDVGASLQYSSLFAVLNTMFSSPDIRPIVIFQTDGDQLFNIKPDSTLPNAPTPPIQTAFTQRELMATIERSRATIYSVISGYSLLGLTPDERRKKATPFLQKQFGNKVSENTAVVSAYADRLFRQQTSMSAIAKLSGGFSENLENPEQADAIYSNILTGITNRYLIGYYPTNSEKNSKRRSIKITVKNHPEYIIWGRKSYYALSPKK